MESEDGLFPSKEQLMGLQESTRPNRQQQMDEGLAAPGK